MQRKDKNKIDLGEGSSFEDMIAEGMAGFLKEEFSEATPDKGIVAKASQESTEELETPKVFAYVVEELVKCADQLDELGHPLVERADEILDFVDSELSSLAKQEKINPWAICTASVGRDDPEKFERCVLDVKKQYGIKASVTEDQFVKKADQSK